MMALSERSFKIIPLIFALHSCTFALAQAPDRLSLPDALAYALNNNPQISASVARIERARADVSAAKSTAQPEFSLPDALAYALNHNLQMSACVARIERARADVSAAKSTAQPEFALRASARLQAPLQEFAIPIGDGSTISITRALQGSVSAGVVWPVWTGGRVAAATGAARAQLDATEADLQQAAEQLLYEVAVGYYRVLIARSAVAAAESEVRRAAQSLHAANTQRAAGTVTAARVSAATAEHRRAQEGLKTAQNALLDAEQGLNRLLGRGLDSDVRLVDEPLTLDAPQEGDEAVRIALTTRPELLALDHRVEAAQKTIAQARAERQPTISTVAEAALQTTTSVAKEHSEFIGLQFSWPILNHSGSRARQRGARAGVEELEQTKADLESVVGLQVAESARRVSDAREGLAAAEEALRAAEAAARETRVGRQAGTVTGQSLVAAESALEQAHARHRQAEYGLSTALLGRARALGLMRGMFLTPEQGAGR